LRRRRLLRRDRGLLLLLTLGCAGGRGPHCQRYE
jgi:hypothetical protein